MNSSQLKGHSLSPSLPSFLSSLSSSSLSQTTLSSLLPILAAQSQLLSTLIVIVTQAIQHDKQINISSSSSPSSFSPPLSSLSSSSPIPFPFSPYALLPTPPQYQQQLKHSNSQRYSENIIKQHEIKRNITNNHTIHNTCIDTPVIIPTSLPVAVKR
jgi:hypothetical protein